MKTTSSKRGMNTSPQPQSEPDSTQPPGWSSALLSSATRSSSGRTVWNFGVVGSQKKSSVSRCACPTRSASAAASVVVPEPEAPKMCTRTTLVIARVEDVAQAVAGEVERQRQQKDRQSRPVRHPRRLLEELLRGVQHRPP